MTEQQQEPRSDRVQQLCLRQLQLATDRIQRFDLPKGIIINGLQGVSRSIGIETFLSTKTDVWFCDQYIARKTFYVKI